MIRKRRATSTRAGPTASERDVLETTRFGGGNRRPSYSKKYEKRRRFDRCLSPSVASRVSLDIRRAKPSSAALFFLLVCVHLGTSSIASSHPSVERRWHVHLECRCSDQEASTLRVSKRSGLTSYQSSHHHQ